MNDAISGENATYLSNLYQQYKRNPSSVEPKWQRVFQDFSSNTSSTSIDEKSIVQALQVFKLIQAYREYGHLAANLDPLCLQQPKALPELDPATYGITSHDYDQPVYTDNVLAFGANLRTILEKLKKIYCGMIGIEFMHIQDPTKRSWIQERVENLIEPTADYQKILTHLTKAEFFEKFLNVKFPGAKRFSLEGGESLIPALEKILEIYTQDGVQEICLGMAHRGRLSVLANILHQPIRHILALFQGQNLVPSDFEGSGDVKYHLGYSSDRKILEKQIHLSLTPNPSHLEAVNPVVLGKVRSKQDRKNDYQRKNIAAILLHGDGAFAGQGLVAETLGLAELEGYKTGGSLHIIINNQIGFTTSPSKARSTAYASDIAKVTQAPIFHVNGDHPEDVIHACSIAAEFVREFQVDAIVDMNCYRRYGHNEADEPSFTQPIMYNTIKSHKTVRTQYVEHLKNNSILSDKQITEIEQSTQQLLTEELESSVLDEKDKKPDWLEGSWSSIKKSALEKIETGVDKKLLKKLSLALYSVPENFYINSKIKKQFDHRTQLIQDDLPLDWAAGEALAFATLLSEGKIVRLSGQDSCRGTFSHRHAILVDQENGNEYIPLNNLGVKQAVFEGIDSPLTEASVLGFDYGYSVANPDALVLWEAQFGDFANGAQVIIDQFISSAEKKWSRLSGIVMLLPHGMEGQGPEHSSARLERYLQLCAEDNMHVVNCTTPANFFHVLRRQLHNSWRKPLIVMTPKSLLRHKLAVSSLDDMTSGKYFLPVITDNEICKATRVILCSGKIYYDLLEAREQQKINNLALLRLEQYYPFPESELLNTLSAYDDIPVVWCQEEPQNMGAWNFIDRRLEDVLKRSNKKHTRPYYAGRKAAAAPATGIAGRHEKEQNEVIQYALFGSLEG
ncbi:MAG: 2-oxoglutarate dehydrogenase E1 component [Pseudomonadota bacterium]|jgi:2-oxoglutarate dehydrogenase E1 component|nr:2-oxoglutarate dehydrogenase E1 component [Alphaproteobacteria bacterium]